MSAPLPLEEAQARLLALAAPLPIEHIAVEEAQGYYLAAPLTAQRTQPAADLSAMDGYALAPGDLPGPWRVVGESAAGHPYAGTIRAGEAVRISTGALLPHGADIVLCQEDATRDGDTLRLTGTPPHPADAHIRRTGFDFGLGHPLLPAGTWIGPAQIALAMTAGHKHLPVHRAPRLAILDSGDELAPPGPDCPAHQIPASNGAMLAAMAAPLPSHIQRLGPVPDDQAALVAALHAASDADVIVTSGGASVGDHDLIRPALREWGADIDFWRVAIRPGKPLLIAQRGAQIVLGLPGNPVASLVTAHFFLLPLLRQMLGAARTLPMPMRATLAEDVGAGGARREFLRGAWDGQSVTPRMMRDSSALASMALSNCLIERAANAPPLQAGENVMIYLLQAGGMA